MLALYLVGSVPFDTEVCRCWLVGSVSCWLCTVWYRGLQVLACWLCILLALSFDTEVCRCWLCILLALYRLIQRSAGVGLLALYLVGSIV